MDDRKATLADFVIALFILFAPFFTIGFVWYEQGANNLRSISRDLEKSQTYLEIVAAERSILLSWAREDGLSIIAARKFEERLISPPDGEREAVSVLRKSIGGISLTDTIINGYFQERMIYEEYKNWLFERYPPSFNYELCFQMRTRKMLKEARNCGRVKESGKFVAPNFLGPLIESFPPSRSRIPDFRKLEDRKIKI